MAGVGEIERDVEIWAANDWSGRILWDHGPKIADLDLLFDVDRIRVVIRAEIAQDLRESEHQLIHEFCSVCGCMRRSKEKRVGDELRF